MRFNPEIPPSQKSSENKGEEAPLGWKTANRIMREVGASDRILKVIINQCYEENVNIQSPVRYLSKRRQMDTYYPPEVIEYVQQALEKRREIGEAPEGWQTVGGIKVELKKNTETVKTLITHYYNQYPATQQPMQYLSQRGQMDTYYPPEVTEYIQQEVVKSREVGEAPDDWQAISGMAVELKTNPKRVRELIAQCYVQNQNTPSPMKYLQRGKVYTYYPPEVTEYIKKWEANNAPEDWQIVREIARETGVDDSTIKTLIAQYYSQHPVTQQPVEYFIQGISLVHYPPEVTEYVRQELAKKRVINGEAPVGWQTVGGIMAEFKTTTETVKTLITHYYSQYPATQQPTRYLTNDRLLTHYPPEVIEYVRHKIQKKREMGEAPEGWQTIVGIARAVGGNGKTVKGIVAQYYVQNQNTQPAKKYLSRYFSQRGQVYTHYPPEVTEYVRKELEKRQEIGEAPASWRTVRGIARELKFHNEGVQKLITRYYTQNSDVQLPMQYLSQRGQMDTYYPPEVIAYVQQEISVSRQDLSKDLRTYLENPAEIDTLKNIIAVFGSAQAIDVLYALHPEYKGIPVEKVKSDLAEYLGDYLLTTMPFSLENARGAEELFGNQTLMEGLSEVIKRDALHNVLQQKADDTEQTITFFRTYFDNLRAKAENTGSTELMKTIIATEKYFIGVFSIDIPGTMVKNLEARRQFPDIYQRINMREIAEKRRILIADEMGVGKSASAIFSKESLGVRTALVVVPSNVVAVWQDYLSDKIDASGKPTGYFASQPHVLAVTDISQLENIQAGQYEYIIVSHERLTEEYTRALEQTDYGMLIVDEVHKLKNIREGVRAEHLLRLSRNGEGEEKYLALLSGTPVPNKVEDVAMLLKLIYPDRFGDYDTRTLISGIVHGDLLDLRQLLLPRMQMKSLAEHIEMPKLTESVVSVTLAPEEEEIYQVLLDEDELTPMEKMQMLQQFLLNHKLLDITPGVPDSKVSALGQQLRETFTVRDKVVVFVNDYVENVIRGTDAILGDLHLPADVIVRVIHGDNKTERASIQAEFQHSSERILLVVSGQTADVGVDYSRGEEIIFYNEPWTLADKFQQQCRVYRPGIGGAIEAKTLLTKGTIEEGKHHYIKTKYRAIEKLLKGIPITEVEMSLLEKTEETDQEDLAVNADLADYYFSSFEKMNRIFASIKEIGEKNFNVFLEKYGTEYADCYRELGSRSYQSNASRVSAAVIEAMAKDQGKTGPIVLDLASGPEMLRRHIGEALQEHIISLDINPEHFTNLEKKDQAIVGSFARVPIAEKSVDYVNLSLALHYSKLVPSKGEYERIRVFAEMSRILRVGGRAVINMIYSLDFRDEDALTGLAGRFGLRKVEEYSGEAISGKHYQSRLVTFEKMVEQTKNLEEIIAEISQKEWEGLKFQRTDTVLKDSRKILSEFILGGREFRLNLNKRDQMLAVQETNILREGELLKSTHGSIADIPREEVIDQGFVRLKMGKNKYLLFKKIPDGGAVIVK